MPADPLTLTCLACGRVNRLAPDRLAQGPRCGACGAAIADGSIADLDLATLERAVARDGLPLLVDLWAPWCGPCRAMAPEFAAAARALAPGVRLARIDTERHPDAAVRFAVRGIPLLILFAAGRERARLTGARPAREIAAFVEEGLAALA
ncbi:MAG: thioredoxin family protein [Rhodobacteraceae bacterium]|nr:thioredoxin family protein [Paracoccaceae bacterium]